MVKNKIGTLKIVASTGGLKLFDSDEWLNPAQKITDQGMNHLKSLKSKKVELLFNDKGKYTNIELYADDTIEASQDCASTQTTSTGPNTQTTNNQIKIIRQACLKVSGEVMKSFDSADDLNPKQLSAITIEMAEYFEAWVNRKC